MKIDTTPLSNERAPHQPSLVRLKCQSFFLGAKLDKRQDFNFMSKAEKFLLPGFFVHLFFIINLILDLLLVKVI